MGVSMNTEVRGMQNPIGSTILRGKAAIEEVQALLTQLVQHDKDLATVRDDITDLPFTIDHDLAITKDEVLAVIQARRDSVVRLLENKSIMIRPDVENLTCGFTDSEGDEA
jgi:hypothetical protein